MNKRARFYLITLMVFVIVCLTGCGQNAADSTNTYKLPLGDSGYISDMDFALDKTEDVYTEDEDGNKTLSYSLDYTYIEAGKTYNVTIKAGVASAEKKDANGKHIKFVVGYYNDENEFVPYDNSESVISLALITYDPETDEAILHDYSFTFTAGETTKNAVIKMSYGTRVDQQALQAEGLSTKEVNKKYKQCRGCSISFDEFSIVEDQEGATAHTLLYETATNGKVITKQNSDLYYFNTGTVAWATETLSLSLNYKGGFWIWWQWIIFQLGNLLNWLTNLLGGAYWLALLVMTLLLRSAAWPIYAKSNNMTYKMQAIQPEIDKLNKKYEGRTDQNSKMKQQMEMKKLMKDNNVRLLGCLMPFAQMPIFIAVYQVVQRFPLTPLYLEGSINFNFLWTTFAMDYGQATGSWILALIVGATMVASQELTTFFTKKVQKKRRNFYTAKNQQNGMQMRIMMLVMTVMMVVFAWNSAGIAFYWIVGNCYQIAQTAISKTSEAKREEKKTGKPRGRN